MKNINNKNMKNIDNFIFEKLTINKQSKIMKEKPIKIPKNRMINRDCPGWSFDWIAIKDRWAVRGDPCMHYSLICYPNDPTKNIIVLTNYAWYEGGYDQGYAASRKLYLNTIMSGGRSNGSGIDREVIPYEYDLHYDWDDLYEYLTKGTHFSKTKLKALDDRKMEFPPGTKKSEIKQQLDR